MLNEAFISNGYHYIPADFYLDQYNSPSLHDLKKMFDTVLEDDGLGFRRRAYLKLKWDRDQQSLEPDQNQFYFQSPDSNAVDGGKIRQFKVMDERVMAIPLVLDLLKKNIEMINACELFDAERQLTIGMHFIRYVVKCGEASYSSPDWLHVDDEPLVFIHLVNLSKDSIGGDNLIADRETKKVSRVIRLENELETLVVNRNVLHAVTPLGARRGEACRDVILFTVEPRATQQRAPLN